MANTKLETCLTGRQAQNPKLIFMGTPEFAVPCLDILVKNGYNVVGVITVPDKPAGRGLEIQQSAVKKYAIEHKLKVLQPDKLKNEDFIKELKNLNADLQIVVAFRMLPEVVWNMPRLGTFNLHASLLPHYRGAAPINWAIINGEKETGVTTFFLKHEIDTGDIIYREKVTIDENTTAGELHDKLMSVGSELVLKTVQVIATGNPQLETQSTFLKQNEEPKHAPKIFKDDCKINWTKCLNEVHDFIRGLSPYPAAFTEFISPDEKKSRVLGIKIFRTTKETGNTTSIGEIISDNKTFIKIAVNGGYINILELQLAGKKKVKVAEFLNGFKFTEKGWKAQ